MKRNGFTLIELLAVIVILAIIALIATPIILGIISDAKKESQERSAELYLSGVELAIARRNLTQEFNPEECTITQGAVTCTIDGEEVPLEVEVDGEVPISGTIKFENNKVAKDTTLTFEGFSATIKEDGKLELGTVTSQEPEEDKPDFYIYASDTTNPLTVEGPAPSIKSPTPPTGRNVYIGYKESNGNISTAYVCFVKVGEEYCLKGNYGDDPATYEKNIDIVKTVYQNVGCNPGSDYFACMDENLMIMLNKYGQVDVFYGNTENCLVSGSGQIVCPG